MDIVQTRFYVLAMSTAKMLVSHDTQASAEKWIESRYHAGTETDTLVVARGLTIYNPPDKPVYFKRREMV